MKNYTTVFGIVEHVNYYNPTSGFSVIVVNSEENLITIVGQLGEFKVGEYIEVTGELDIHPVFGKQIKAVESKRSMPTTSFDILKYLSSGAIKGVGPSTAKKLVDTFGDDTLKIIESEPKKLTEIYGISLRKALNISEEYNSQFGMRDAVLFLTDYDISYNETLKIYKEFGASTVDIIRSNPFVLCKDDIGFSFERCDEIASKLGFGQDSTFRIYTGIIYVLKHNLNNGHTCLPRHKHIKVCSALLQLEEKTIDEIINNMIISKDLFSFYFDNVEYIMLPLYYNAEKNISNRIKMMLNFPPKKIPNFQDEIDKLQDQLGFCFESKQFKAIEYAANNGLLILTGGPGTGKTTTLNGIIKLFENNSIKFSLAAPTGRAAKRISEITSKDACTIHRLLEVEWDENGKAHFCKNANNTLDVQAVIIDEFSMIDSVLFDSLLKALPIGCRLIMVGDSNQLPSVGAGNVLQDLIDSDKVPTVELTEVFRQSIKSDIIKNAHKILNGETIQFNNTQTDFFFTNIDNSAKVNEIVRDLVTRRIPDKFNFDSLNEIQVLCPSKKRENGTIKLNNILQNSLNPKEENKKEISFMTHYLRVGDKIIQTKNNYDIEWVTDKGEEGTGVFNGDLGIITDFNYNNQTIKIKFDDKTVTYPFDKTEEIELAYALTIHKSQGSEFECVVIPICDIPTPLIFRNLLYTAITRAKKILIIVGSLNQLNKMIENNKKTKRYTALKSFLVNDYED